MVDIMRFDDDAAHVPIVETTRGTVMMISVVL